MARCTAQDSLHLLSSQHRADHLARGRLDISVASHRTPPCRLHPTVAATSSILAANYRSRCPRYVTVSAALSIGPSAIVRDVRTAMPLITSHPHLLHDLPNEVSLCTTFSDQVEACRSMNYARCLGAHDKRRLYVHAAVQQRCQASSLIASSPLKRRAASTATRPSIIETCQSSARRRPDGQSSPLHLHQYEDSLFSEA